MNYFGKFLDGVIGQTIESLFFLCCGTGLYRSGEYSNFLRTLTNTGEGFPLLVMFAGAAAMGGHLLSSYIKQGYYSYYVPEEKEAASSPDPLTRKIQSSRYSNHWWYLLYLNLGSFSFQVILLLFCCLLRSADLFVLFYASFYLLQTVLFLVFYLYRAGRTLT